MIFIKVSQRWIIFMKQLFLLLFCKMEYWTRINHIRSKECPVLPEMTAYFFEIIWLIWLNIDGFIPFLVKNSEYLWENGSSCYMPFVENLIIWKMMFTILKIICVQKLYLNEPITDHDVYRVIFVIFFLRKIWYSIFWVKSIK